MAAAREFSAGGVVVREVEGRFEVAVIRPTGRSNVLALPKGHIDPGETGPQAATREVREETGLEVDLVEKLGDVKYVYRFRGKTIFKVVSFFLFRHRSGEINALEERMRVEVDEAKWLAIDEAVTALSYRGEKEMLGKARELLTRPTQP